MPILEKNKFLIEQYFYEVWNKGRLDILDKIISEDYINHSPGIPNPLKGPAGLRPIILAIRSAVSNLNYEIRNLVLSEEKVAVHCVMRGTHEGDLFGLPATGNHIEVQQMQIERISQGKIVEHWRVTDDLMMLRQLKSLPEC